MKLHPLCNLSLLILVLTMCLSKPTKAQTDRPLTMGETSHKGIDRKAVVTRHNPHVTSVDTMASLTVGNGSFAVTVDATGLQTFPELYRNGVPLGTMSEWGWHDFPNPEGYKLKDVLREYDFGRGHKESYAIQPADGRGADAADWLRRNPNRIHLGCVGFDFGSPDSIADIDETLNMWTGCVDSRFDYQGQPFHVETVCDPDEDILAARIHSNKGFRLMLRIPYPTGAHSDDACNWNAPKRHIVSIEAQGNDFITLAHYLDDAEYYISWVWRGNAKLTWKSDLCYILESQDSTLEFYVDYAVNTSHIHNTPMPFADFKMASAGSMADYWNEGRFLDFSNTTDPRAHELERRIIQSQYIMNTQEHGMMPPAETGLTYNSWYGKFHLEMAWWHLAHWALWRHPSRLDKSMEWYLHRMGNAQQIARRQKFRGIRWMKMTDALGGEAPSNTGSFLIWQQPEPIFLAELLYQAVDSSARLEHTSLLKKFGALVDQTADFMGSFVKWDSTGTCHLNHYIPAQESISKDSTCDSPLELAEWYVGLTIAQNWRTRLGYRRRPDWDRIIDHLPVLAYNKDSLYLPTATASDSYTRPQYISDHPAVLGAYGMMPSTRLVDPKIMRKTADWIFRHWRWDTSWGWDFPMMAMTYARLGDGDKAVESLLFDTPKNTWLANGHNWQSRRLRVYTPGNGGLLSAVALMADLDAFPKEWNISKE